MGDAIHRVTTAWLQEHDERILKEQRSALLEALKEKELPFVYDPRNTQNGRFIVTYAVRTEDIKEIFAQLEKEQL